MLDFIFTIDYELYGNGEGSLTELVYEPMSRLIEIFERHAKKMVVFVDVAEFEMIEKYRTDPAIDKVKTQITELHKKGFEIGMHIHPQWYNARFMNGSWILDYNEYNLCVLSRKRIIQIIDQSIAYLQSILGDADFIPICFRAGNWLFQPTQIIAEVLSQKGIKIDSSVYKGGKQYRHKLDYRESIRNGYYWKFRNDVNMTDSNGIMFELPIHTQMVPFWKMLTKNRIGLQRKKSSFNKFTKKVSRCNLDFIRFQYPLKLDFCRMTINEIIQMMEKIIKKHDQNPSSYCPIVSIGHTKDLQYYDAIQRLLIYLEQKKIAVATFNEIYPKITNLARVL